jgi:hypothetical protein
MEFGLFVPTLFLLKWRRMNGNKSKKDWLELDRPERWRGKPGPPKPYLSDLKMEKRRRGGMRRFL